MENFKEHEEGTFLKLKNSFNEIFGKPELRTLEAKAAGEENGRENLKKQN